MKFTFTELNYEKEFRFGGKLEVKAESSVDVEQMIDHFRLFNDLTNVETLKARIAALESGKLSHTIESDKRPVYAVECCLDHDFTLPYKDWAKDNFGYDGTFPNLNIPRKWNGLIHTNYQNKLHIEHEHICVEAFISAQPWNGKDAQDYAESLVKRYLSDEFGQTYHEPEFIHTAGGQYKKNPNYLKTHAPKPAATNPRLKKAFFKWWLECCANEAQKIIVAGNREISKNAKYMSAFEFERFEDRIYYECTGNDYKSISFADFAKLESV